jgi:hypothetical protein
MNIDKKFLKSLILEEMEFMLSEEDEKPVEQTSRLSRDSVDDQIDSFILKFESQSMTEDEEEDDMISESLSDMSLETFLIEQEEPEEEIDIAPEEVKKDDDAGESDSDDMDKSSDMGDVEKVEDVPKLPLNINEFTKSIARLALNSETLLDIKRVIVMRAQNFLKENYDDSHAEEMNNILESEFDFNLSNEDETPEAPYAVGAYAGGTGGMGGGGGG